MAKPIDVAKSNQLKQTNSIMNNNLNELQLLNALKD